MALGWAALAEGDFLAAAQPLEECINTSRKISDRNDEAWALAAMSAAAHGLGRREQARAHLREAAAHVLKTRALYPLLHLLPVIALVLADAEDASLKERAIELYALAESDPFVREAQLFEDVAGKHIAAAAATLPPHVVEAAQARGRSLDWWETAQVLLEELGPNG
jgi:hypothetical protein